MANELTVNVWWDRPFLEQFRLFKHIFSFLTSAEGATNIPLIRFNELTVNRRNLGNGVEYDVSKAPHLDLVKILDEHFSESNSFYISGDIGLQKDVAETASVELRRTPFVINLFGPAFGREGELYKGLGALQLSFGKTRYFRSCSSCSPNRNSDPCIICNASRLNFSVVIEIVKWVITNTTPTHLLVRSGDHINPLMSHAIFHKEYGNYVKDLDKIAMLYTKGGHYIFDASPKNIIFDQAISETDDYGHLRNAHPAVLPLFLKNLNLIVQILEGRNIDRNLSFEFIERCFSGLLRTGVEITNESFFLYNLDAADSYLEEPFFTLSDCLDKNRIES